MQQSTAVDEKLAKFTRFCRRYLDDGAGGEWSLDGRDYVLNEIWRPLVGFRLMPPLGVTVADLCAVCAPRVAEIVTDERAPAAMFHAPDCPGLVAVPLVIVAVNVPRRSGKTHAILSFAMASIFLERNKRYAFVASAEDQADELIEQKLLRPLRKHKDIAGFWKLLGNKIETYDETGAVKSWIEILPTADNSTAGRGFTGVFVDESRGVPSPVAASLIPAIFDCHGVECPKGHGQWTVSSQPNAKRPPNKCPTCSRPTERWYGRALFASSSGIIKGNPEKDWFANFIERRTERPHPNVHVWYTDQSVNPSVSAELVNAVASAFDDVDGISEHIAVEISNKSIRKGKPYLSKPQVDAVVDRSLRSSDAGVAKAVAFLDTAVTQDLTSLVIVADEAREGEPSFFRQGMVHWKTWDPDGEAIDEMEVENHLRRVLPMFPNLKLLEVDVRGNVPWSTRMVKRLRASGFSRVQAYTDGDDEMWATLLDHIAQKRIRLPDLDRLLKELNGLQVKERNGKMVGVTDQNARADGRARSRTGLHRDVSMALAAACHLGALQTAREEMHRNSQKVASANTSERLRSRLKPLSAGLKKEQH